MARVATDGFPPLNLELTRSNARYYSVEFVGVAGGDEGWAVGVGDGEFGLECHA